MNEAKSSESLKQKHSDVFDNEVVDKVVYWQEPVLGDGEPPNEKSDLDFKKMTGILADRTAYIFD